MTIISWFFLASAVMMGSLAFLAVRHQAPVSQRGAAIAILCASLPTVFLAFGELLGRDKPVRLEWYRANTESAAILQTHMVENEAIYLWLILKGEQEPRAYSLDWDKETAKALYEAMEEARKNGTSLQMALPFEKKPGRWPTSVLRAAAAETAG